MRNGQSKLQECCLPLPATNQCLPKEHDAAVILLREASQPVATKALRVMGVVSLSLLLLLAGCGGDEPSATTEPVGADTSTSFSDTAEMEDTGAEDAGTTDTGSVDTGQDDTGADEDTSSADTGAPDAGAPDAGEDVCPGGFGCGCGENGDCDSGYCIETPAGKKCTVVCVDSCPSEDFKCVVTGSGGDTATICVPKLGNLCNPCNANNECQVAGHGDARCIDQGAGGAFCGTGCSADKDCSTGYACKDVKDIAGGDVKQCVPSAGVCECSNVAIAKELSTKCFKEVGGAKCLGKRTCLADGKPDAPKGGGLSACLADTPVAETCDGKDNDCDGETDENTCDDKQACTLDSCNPTSGCKHTNKSGPCDADGTVCTEGDACADGKCAAGNLLNCDDKNPCTKDSCDAKLGCQYAPTQAPCNADDNDCTVGDTCNKGKCEAGTSKACDPGKPCVTGSCSVVTGKCKYDVTNGLSCNDGNPCTKNDKCKDETCKGVALDCDDSNPCTNDACDGKIGCKNTATTAKCDADGDACTEDDACAAGKCVAGKKTDCDDSEACTADSCDTKTGKCINTQLKVSCDDGDACTTSDACGASGSKWTCVGGAAKNCDDSLNCTVDSCDPKKGCKNESAVGKAIACYTGDAKTRGVGTCKDGSQTCKQDGTLSPCAGEVTPAAKEVCGDSKDNTCDGNTDENCAPTGVSGRLASASVSGTVGKLKLRATLGASAAAGEAKGTGKLSIRSGFYAWLSGLIK